jgi:hypothetical protein
LHERRIESAPLYRRAYMAHTIHIGQKTVCLKDYAHICGAAVIHPKIEDHVKPKYVGSRYTMNRALPTIAVIVR